MSELVLLPLGPAQEAQSTIFADDIYLWSSTQFSNNLKLRLQAAPDHVTVQLVAVALEILLEKSSYMVFPRNGRRAKAVLLTLGPAPVKRDFNQRYFGVPIDTRNRWRF